MALGSCAITESGYKERGNLLFLVQFTLDTNLSPPIVWKLHLLPSIISCGGKKKRWHCSIYTVNAELNYTSSSNSELRWTARTAAAKTQSHPSSSSEAKNSQLGGNNSRLKDVLSTFCLHYVKICVSKGVNDVGLFLHLFFSNQLRIKRGSTIQRGNEISLPRSTKQLLIYLWEADRVLINSSNWVIIY